MTSPLDRSLVSPWEAEGQRVASALDGRGAAAVIGDDPTAAAEVALGIGRVQARRRRVAVADAVGELAPIEDLAPMDAPHGLIDTFLYGVSLAKAAYPVDRAGNLHVVPSGLPPLDHDSLLGNERWSKLAAGFREGDALLLVVAPADAATLPALAAMLDGVVLVGAATAPAGARVLAHASLPIMQTRPTTNTRVVTDEPPPTEAVAPAPSPTPASDAPARSAPAPTAPSVAAPSPPTLRTVKNVGARPVPVWMAIIAAAAIAVALVTWASQRFAPSSPPPAATTTHASDATVAPPVPAAEPAPAAAAATPVPDTVAAVPFAVRLGELSSYSGAIARLAQEATRGTPAATYAPDTATAGHYVFRLYAGALRTDTAADSLLRQLRARRVAGPDARVARVPYALLVQSGIARDQVASFVSGYDAKGLRVYPLLQSDGSVSLYAGAFESPDQARVLLTTFRARGESPSVTYRTGRTP